MKYVYIPIYSALGYKKGDRLIVEYEGKYFVGTISSIRAGQIYLQFDDGDSGKVSVGSKRILGQAKNTKVKKALSKSEALRYLLTEDKKPAKSPKNQTTVNNAKKEEDLETLKNIISKIESKINIMRSNINEDDLSARLYTRDLISKITKFLEKSFTFIEKETKNNINFTRTYKDDNFLIKHSYLAGEKRGDDITIKLIGKQQN